MDCRSLYTVIHHSSAFSCVRTLNLQFFEFLIEKLSGPSPSQEVKAMDTSGIVLVAGATGGVGRRVVDLLRKKGRSVRVLVRNEEKARRMLGQDVDMIVGDITKASTLVPEYFKGVRMVINAISVIVGPKEGDTPDRTKYSQGIKFFEPEVFTFLDHIDLCQAARVCKKWRDASSHEDFWGYMYFWNRYISLQQFEYMCQKYPMLLQ